MANEWVKVELYGANNDGNPRRYTIADGTSVSKGTLLALTDPRTVTAADATSTAIAGVASEEHIANDGVTTISAWTDGIFNATSSGAVTVGGGIVAAESNKVISGAVGVYGYIGYVLETFTNGQTKQVRLLL